MWNFNLIRKLFPIVDLIFNLSWGDTSCFWVLCGFSCRALSRGVGRLIGFVIQLATFRGWGWNWVSCGGGMGCI